MNKVNCEKGYYQIKAQRVAVLCFCELHSVDQVLGLSRAGLHNTLSLLYMMLGKETFVLLCRACGPNKTTLLYVCLDGVYLGPYHSSGIGVGVGGIKCQYWFYLQMD